MATKLKDQILSEENLYNAIYALESYIPEYGLLSKDDQSFFFKLKDKYDFNGNISTMIKACQDKLKNILSDEKCLFEVNVYFKMKKLSDEKEPQVEYRPLHTASLKDQICMAAMLMPLMFDDSTGKRNLSELSRMLPHNFYGNIPSCNVQSIFMNWTDKYRQYTEIVNNKSREYSKTREYDKEISFDLKDFFPSINPKKILNFIWNAISGQYHDNEDKQTLKTVITKLLYFKIPETNLEGWKDTYYKGKGDIEPLNGYFPTRGIAQGLPQSYFFGNLCMIEVADKMNKLQELGKSDAYFYVDDSVCFARDINPEKFKSLISKLNDTLIDTSSDWIIEPALDKEFEKMALALNYKIEFHGEGKSSICDIDDSFKGMDGLFLVQRPVSMGGWINGNIDEVDDNVALKKLNALQELVDDQIRIIREQIKITPPKEEEYKTRLKWLSRYKRYFLFRQRKLQLILNGEYEKKLVNQFLEKFKIDKLISQNDKSIPKEILKGLFETFEEDIFKAEFELIAKEMPLDEKTEFCDKIKKFDTVLSLCNHNGNRNAEYLYYHKLSTELEKSNPVFTNGYESLAAIIRKTRPFRNPEKFIEGLKKKSLENDDAWTSFSFMRLLTTEDIQDTEDNLDREFPEWCKFIFRNSESFKRKILNCCFSLACNIVPGDNFSILRTDIKPIKYYELRTIAMLRNPRLKIHKLFEFLRNIDCSDLNERMEIDLGILEGLGIFRQKVQDPDKVDKLIQTHRLVKSLWHNGSKFLNAYTLHNQEHAINLIKNVIRLVNNVDFLNLKSNDFFLLFNACYLHDISMVIHPSISSFNESNPKSERLISKWMKKMNSLNDKLDHAFKYNKLDISQIHLLRKEMGRDLVEVFQDVFDFFEDKVRTPHAHESAKVIRVWQAGMLSFLNELEAETVATISDSHGWDLNDVYELKSAAKEELVSLKYMMILIRIADLLDLANDRIDYFLLKQNRSQMNPISRYHWISHLITDKYELDVDFEVSKDTKLSDTPITEKIHLDIFLNTEIIFGQYIGKSPCKGITANLEMQKQERYPDNTRNRNCLIFKIGNNDEPCNGCTPQGNGRRCPFLCIWMSNKHQWLFSEFGKLKHYLNSVNSKLIKSDIDVRFFFDNTHKLDAEFFDDVKSHLVL